MKNAGWRMGSHPTAVCDQKGEKASIVVADCLINK